MVLCGLQSVIKRYLVQEEVPVVEWIFALFPKNWEMNKQLGDYESDKTLWDQHTVITQVDKIKDGDLALIIDCGEQDFFLEVNKALHKVLLEKISAMISLPSRWA